MQRTAAGDEQAFRGLVEHWERPVLVFLERMLGNREDARDLAQETFVRVYAQARGYRPAGQFRAWLFRIAGNLARSALRRRRILRWVRFEPAEHERPVAEPGAIDRLAQEETRQAVHAALTRLPDRQRQAMVLLRYQGLSYKEIAAAMETSVAGVESLVQRASAALRRELIEVRKERP